MIPALNVKSDLSEVLRMSNDMQQKQVKFATARALTWCAKDAQEAVNKEIKRVFDRPTPWTLKSTFVEPATKAKLFAAVKIKDDKLNARVAAIDWLAPQIYGGQRGHKGFEMLLNRYSRMPAGHYAIPTSHMPLDRFGNVSRGELQRVLSDLRVQQFDAAQNSTARSRKRRAGSKKRRASFYFSTYPRNARTAHLRPGIYQRVDFGFGSSIRPAFIFAKRAVYSTRLKFHDVAHKAASASWQRRFNESLNLALATAR